MPFRGKDLPCLRQPWAHLEACHAQKPCLVADSGCLATSGSRMDQTVCPQGRLLWRLLCWLPWSRRRLLRQRVVAAAAVVRQMAHLRTGTEENLKCMPVPWLQIIDVPNVFFLVWVACEQLRCGSKGKGFHASAASHGTTTFQNQFHSGKCSTFCHACSQRRVGELAVCLEALG